jgi:hypothetical protein
MAKNTAVEPRQTRDLELKSILCELATGQQRLSALQDELAARRRTLRDKENHHQGMLYRMADAAEGRPEPPIQFERRKKVRADFKREESEIAQLTSELQTRQKEFDDLTDTVNVAQRRCAEIQAAIDSERQIRISETVKQAADTAPSRDDAHAAREKLYRLRARHTQIERELGVLMTAPRQESVEQKAAEFLANEVMPSERPEHSEAVKRLILGEKTVRVAISLQERELRRLQSKYGGEIAKTLRPANAALYQRISDALDIVLAAGIESDMLLTVASIEAGTETFQTARYPYLPGDFGNSDHPVRTWQRRGRIAGLLV